MISSFLDNVTVKNPNRTMNFATHSKFGVRFGRWFCALQSLSRFNPVDSTAWVGLSGPDGGVPGRAGATPGYWPAGRPKPCSVVLTTSRVAPAHPGTSCLRRLITNPSKVATQGASNMACITAIRAAGSSLSSMQAADQSTVQDDSHHQTFCLMAMRAKGN
jgi:hypothetical protein